MQEYKYSAFATFIYRYANIPATLLLSVHLTSSFVLMFNEWDFVFPFIINLVVIILLNRFYFRSYKKFPFHIKADNEKIICSDFFMSTKIIEIKHSDITNIRGGMFSGNNSRPIYISDNNRNIEIGFNIHIKNFNQLLTTILKNINQDLYNEILEKTKELGELRRDKARSKKRTFKKTKSG